MNTLRVLFSSALILISVAESNSQVPSEIRGMDSVRRSEGEVLEVFHQWFPWKNSGTVLANHVLKDAIALYKERDGKIAALGTKKAWQQRQDFVRRKLEEILGPFPERTPLDAQVTGTIDGAGYRIEKIIYQSHAGSFVTGCLYIPKNLKGKIPAVLNLIGHEQESFRATLDQVMATNLVKKGMIVFTIDPPGQGEHVQYFDPRINFSSIGYSVVEHCYFGNQCFLSGVSSARYFIWDAIRAIDYLVSRKEVDPGRIGVTGFSGGGTITSYVAALDNRVSVAVPSSWSTSNRRQLETKGAQDAEANLIHGLRHGLTFEDLIEVRAPRPTLMTFVSRDEYLAPQGARDAYAEARKVYSIFGVEGNLQYVEDDARHWLTPLIRRSIYAFFMKHFGIGGRADEEDVEVFLPSELNATSSGQIASSVGGAMIFDVNLKSTSTLLEQLETSRQDGAGHIRRAVEDAKRLSGYRDPATAGQAFFLGRYQREGYTVSKHALQGEGDYYIPFLLFVPDKSSQKLPALIYLHPEGKASEAKPGGEIEKLVRAGFVVAATDVLGRGETKNTATTSLAVNYTALLTGRSIIGIQAADIVRVAKYLRSREDIDSANVGGYASEQMCLPLLHAAAFDDSIQSVFLKGGLISYRRVATNRLYSIGLIKRAGGGTHHPYDIDFSWGIANVLTAYDLPDLMASLWPRRVVATDFRNEKLQPVSDSVLHAELKFPLETYRSMNAADKFKLVASDEFDKLLFNWQRE